MTKWIQIAAAAVLCAAGVWLGTGLHPIWWLTWLAPLPVMLAASSVSARSAFAFAAAAWFAGNLNVWQYLHRVGVPPPVVLFFLALPAIVFGLDVVLYRAFLKCGSPWRAAFLAPTLWVTYEFLSALVSPHGTFFNLGYTQTDCLPVLQIVSLTGIWGISFCLFLTPATIAVLVTKTGESRQRTKLACTVAAVLVAVGAYGWWRLVSTPSGPSLTVALVASDTHVRDRESAAKLMHEYGEKTDQLAANGAQLVVLPEKIAVVSDAEAAEWDAILGSAAARRNATVVVGLDHGGDKNRWNEARIYSPSSGKLEAVYDKHHLLPGAEDVDQPGSARVVMEKPTGKWGVAICKDMDFPALSRQYGLEGVGLLIVPAWDFDLDRRLHGRMAVVRGVESGFTIVRSAKQGLLTISDDRGRILVEQTSSVERAMAWDAMSFVVAPTPVRHDETIYLRYGNWFGWMNLAALPVIFILPRRKEPGATAVPANRGD